MSEQHLSVKFSDRLRHYPHLHRHKTSEMNEIASTLHMNITNHSSIIAGEWFNANINNNNDDQFTENHTTNSALWSARSSLNSVHLESQISLEQATNSVLPESVWAESMDENVRNAILIIIYTVIIIVSLFGNSVVLKIMLSRNTPRTATNLLIVNLAFSDLLLTCFNIPVNLVRFVVRDWPFGQQICTMTPFLQSLSAHCSAITMMVIALERYNRFVIFIFFSIYLRFQNPDRIFTQNKFI